MHPFNIIIVLLAWIYLFVHDAYCPNVAKTILFASLSSKASSAVVAVQ